MGEPVPKPMQDDPGRGQRPAEPVFDAHDDLFNFDELIDTPGATPAAGPPYEQMNTAELDSVLGPASAPADRAATVKPPLPVRNPERPSSPKLTPPEFPPDRESPLESPDAPPAIQRLSLPRLVAVVISIAFLLYFPLAFITWRSVDTMRSSVREMGDRLAVTADEVLRSRAPNGDSVESPTIPSALGTKSEGEESLEKAELALTRGDFEGARQRLYALLAVVDRLPEKSRADIEARASYMLGETFRLQADATVDKAEREAKLRRDAEAHK